jgi:fructose-1,6-bisphosphatase/inositol monophosphatase family enzyme
VETEDVLALVKAVAEEVVTPRFGALAAGEVRKKQLVKPVTVADREAEERLTAELQAAYPGALVLGEEAVAADARVLARFRDAEHAFTVDPVDGTRQFVRGSPDHAVMVAELRHGQVVRSWIWQPQHRRAYVAERGAGAWCDGRRLTVSSRPASPSGGVVGRVRALARMRRTGTCCGVDYPRLADGAADYALSWHPRPWDHAPGSLLLAEAGGVVGAPDGSAYAPRGRGPRVMVAAADAATHAAVGGMLRRLPGL